MTRDTNKPTKYLIFANRAEWRAWLEKHHSAEQEAWIVHPKKKVKAGTLTYEEAVEEALCFGWIDGLLRSIDSEKFALRYSPRKPKSIWSEINKRRAERLMREGRMTDAGLEKIMDAQESGEWGAATQREDVDIIPPDLEQALQCHQNALTAFRNLPASRKKQFIWWITSAKRDETRMKRIQATVDKVVEEKSRTE